MDLSRAEHVTLRDRLKARTIVERSTSTGIGVQTTHDFGACVELARAFDSPTRGRYSPSKHRSRSNTPTGDVPRSTALGTRHVVDRMKEKVQDRTALYGAPSPAAVAPAPHQYYDASHHQVEQTRDVYLHAQPFPVNAVYEVERVNTTATTSLKDVNPNVVAPAGGTVVGGKINVPLVSPPSPPKQRPLVSPPSPPKQHPTAPMSAVVHQQSGATETLLLPEESAKLVRTLEDRLSMNLHRVATVENQLLREEAERKEATERMNNYAHENSQLVARNSELERQLQIVRAETRDIIDEGNRTNQAATEAAVDHNNGQWKTVEASMYKDLEIQNQELKNVTRAKLELERMVKELRHQLTQNAGALQTNSQTVKDLTRELISAKQQASSVSSGYREQEKNLKAAQALNHTQRAELESLRNVHADLGEARERASHAEAQLSTASKQLEVLKESEVERLRLDKLNKEMQSDMSLKNKELNELKQKLELVTNQAQQAFQQSNRFHQMASADPATAGYMYSGGGAGGGMGMGGGGGGGGMGDPMAVIRKEIEDEERRTADESRRWRTHLSSPHK